MTTTTRQNPPLKLRPPVDPRDDQDVKRDKIVMVRVTVEERDAWQAAADADQRKLADWIRVAVNAQIKATEPAPAPRKKGGR